MSFKQSYPAIVLFALAFLALPAQAQSPQPSEIVNAGIRYGWKTDSGTHMAALQLTLAQDWITYWRHPGESGIVPRLEWGASDNLANIRVHWPEPRLFNSLGVNSIGYSDELVLPIELVPFDKSKPIRLEAMLRIGVCKDICIPVDLSFQSQISSNGQHDQRIALALTRTPTPATRAGMQNMRCILEPTAKGMQLSVDMDLPATGVREFMLIELPGSDLRSRTLPTKRSGNTVTGQVLMRSGGAGRPMAIDRSAVQISLASENGVVTHQGCSTAR